MRECLRYPTSDKAGCKSNVQKQALNTARSFDPALCQKLLQQLVSTRLTGHALLTLHSRADKAQRIQKCIMVWCYVFAYFSTWTGWQCAAIQHSLGSVTWSLKTMRWCMWFMFLIHLLKFDSFVLWFILLNLDLMFKKSNLYSLHSRF